MTQGARAEARRAARPAPWRSLAVLAAHPDDETIGAGALLARAGAALLVHLTDGAPRDPRFRARGAPPTAEAYAELRRVELAAALQAGGLRGVDVVALGAADQEAALHLAPLTEALARLLAERRPALLLTHAYEGGHPDHDAAALVARAAAALLRRGGLPVPRLVEMTSYHARAGALETGVFLPGGGREVVRRLDEAERDRKRRMLAAFASQQEVLAPFAVAEERFRDARPSPFASPPHEGPLWYELLGFPITGSRWRSLARSALTALGLDLLGG